MDSKGEKAKKANILELVDEGFFRCNGWKPRMTMTKGGRLVGLVGRKKGSEVGR